MSKTYDIIIITNIPSFYKTKLWNRISQESQMLVVYLHRGKDKQSLRSNDFIDCNFHYDHVFIDQNVFSSCITIIRLLLSTKYRRLLLTGYDELPFLIAALISPKKKNGISVESSIYEGGIRGLKARLKYLFYQRMSIALPVGIAQEKLVRANGYKGNIVKSGGCGLLNYVEQPPYQEHSIGARNFIYVGRLIELKRLDLLISVFNKHSELTLEIIGTGSEENNLKSMANDNIHFLGMVDNLKLPNYYRKADVFVLPSCSETWGLVVEEALNNGLPVIVSSHVGCHDDLVTPYTGLVFPSGNAKALEEAILKIMNKDFYNTLRLWVSKMDFNERAQRQINTFIKLTK